MSTEDLFHFACATGRWALLIWGGCFLGAIIIGYIFAAISGAGESGSDEEGEQ